MAHNYYQPYGKLPEPGATFTPRQMVTSTGVTTTAGTVGKTMDAGAISLPLAEKSSRIGRQRIEPGNPPMMGLFTGRSPGPKQLSHEGKYAEEKVPMRVHSRAPKMSLLLNDNIMLEP